MILNASKFNNHWEEKRLSDLGDFKRGKSKHRPRNDPELFTNGKYPLIQTGNVRRANLYINNNEVNYNDKGLAQSKLWPEGTLCITIAANIAETALLKYPMCFPDSVVGFIAEKNKSSELFMHYVFTYIRRAIQKSAGGSIQDNINIDYLTRLQLRIPRKEHQDSIASLLSTLDMKIELNDRMCSLIDEEVETIYNYWFIQFDFPSKSGRPYQASGGEMVYSDQLKRAIPKGWTVKRLGDVVSRIGTGLNPRNHFKLGSGDNYYVTIKSVDDGKVTLDDRCDKIDDQALAIIQRRSDLQIGDILFTSIQPVGITYYIHDRPTNWNINESVFTLRPNRALITSDYLYTLLSSSEMKSFTANSSAGSIHKGIRHSVLKEFKLPFGNKELVDQFSEKVNPLLYKAYLHGEENRRLVKLRDWLLILLMSGQARIE